MKTIKWSTIVAGLLVSVATVSFGQYGPGTYNQAYPNGNSCNRNYPNGYNGYGQNYPNGYNNGYGQSYPNGYNNGYGQNYPNGYNQYGQPYPAQPQVVVVPPRVVVAPPVVVVPARPYANYGYGYNQGWWGRDGYDRGWHGHHRW